MSSEPSARRRKSPEKVGETKPRSPMFELRQDPLRDQPRPINTLRDPFEDFPEGQPRATRRQPVPIARVPATAAPLRAPVLPLAEPGRSKLPRKIFDIPQADGLVGRMPARAQAYQYAGGESPVEFLRGRPWLLMMVALASVLVFWFASATPKTIISGFTGAGPVAASAAISNAFKPQNVNVPAGQHAVLGAPTISAQFIDSVLAHYGSPAAGTGQIWLEMGRRYGIDPAYSLAFFIHESSAGTNPGWAGIKPGGGTTHNVGNIICAGYNTCFGRFRDYDSWDAGIEDWYKLISVEYVNDRGTATIEQIIPIYAPSFENDVNNYVQTVVGLADDWRQGVVR